MTARLTVLGMLVASMAITALPALAQDQVGSLQIESVNIDAHPDVRVTVSVPAHEQGPRDAAAFRVAEDGQIRVAEVADAASSDLQILLLIDTTGSMGGAPLSGAREAATTFLQRLPEDVAVSVMSYAAQASVITDFTADRDDHITGLERLNADGRTATYDAVVAAAATFPEGNGDTARAMVLLTDGEDNESAGTVEDAIAALQAADITLHSVEYLTAFTDEDAIRDLAGATGGSVLEAGDAAALLEVYEDLAAALVNRYSLQYLSEATGLTEISVSVEVDGVPSSDARQVSLPELPPPPPPPDEPVEEPAVTLPAPPEPLTIPPVETSNLGRILLAAGAALWFIALVLVILVLIVSPRRRALQLTVGTERARSHRPALGDLAGTLSSFADRRLEHRGRRGQLNAALERAGIALRPGEFLVFVGCVTITLVALGTLLWSLPTGLVLGAIAVIVARLTVIRMTRQRQKRFADQLGETLQLLSGSLRAGYSFMQALDAVAREADAPAAEEFSRLVVETRLGRDTTEALAAMADRVGSTDFTWVTQAIEIHREVGGNLAEVLDNVAHTIRERNQVRRHIQALSAEGRLSGHILVALPFVVALMMWVRNPAYLAELTNGGLLGLGLITTGLVLMLLGMVWIRKLVRLQF
jgi:tight adherence protein B